MKRNHVRVQSGGTIVLPIELQRRHLLDEPGAHAMIVGHASEEDLGAAFDDWVKDLSAVMRHLAE